LEYQELQQLFKEHKYLDAAKLVPKDAVPKTAEEAIIATRLASRLGNDRLADHITQTSFKQFPENQLIALYEFIWKMGRIGNFKSYIRSRDFLDANYDDPKIGCLYLCTSAMLSSEFHFFNEAEHILDMAQELHDESTWLEQTRVRIADLQDDRKVAGALMDSLLDQYEGDEASQPLLISAICQHLWKYGENERVFKLMDALDAGGCQYYHPLLMRAFYLQELDKFDEAEQIVERIENTHAQYFDRRILQSLTILKFKNAQVFTKKDSMRIYLKDLRGEYYRIIEKNMDAASPNASRILLNVPLVSQKEKTCVPATLASIAAYFGENLNHDEIAEEVCGNGTPHDRIFAWAEAKSWTHRPFTFNFDDARKLLDAGFPFALYTEGLDYKHCQAVIGMDNLTGELLIREPGSVVVNDMLAEEMLKEQALNGPMCVVFAPPSKADKLSKISLKDEEGYNKLIAIETALKKHNIDEAAKLADAIPTLHPATLIAKTRVCEYRMASGERLKLFRESYEQNKKNALARWRYVSSLNFNEQSVERWRALEEICDGAKSPHPMFLQEFANTLTMDSRELVRAEKIAMKAIRHTPYSGMCLHVLAHILALDPARVDEAFLAYRAAAYLEEYHEHFWQEWFDFAWDNHRGDEVLSAMRARAERLGDKTAFPGVTLADAHVRMNKIDDALEILRKQYHRFDETHEAKIRFAQLYSNIEMDKSIALLKNLKDSISATAYRMTLAELLGDAGKWREALKIYEEELAAFPENNSAFSSYIFFRSRVDHSAEFFETLLDDPTTKSNIERLATIATLAKEPQPEVFQRIAEKIVELDPYDTYWLRELAFHHLVLGNVDQAELYHEKTAELAEPAPQTHCLAADIALARKNEEEARKEYVKALEIDVNYLYVYHQLILCAPDSEEDRLALFNTITSLIEKQVISDTCVSGVVHLAENILSSEHVERVLTSIKENRPDVAQVWVELIAISEGEKAEKLIEEGIELFPYDQVFRYRKCIALAVRGEVQKSLKILERVLKLRPLYTQARCYKGFLLGQLYRHEEAEAEYRRAVELAPYDMNSVVALAEYLISTAKKTDAMKVLDKAIKRSPGSMEPLNTKLQLLLRNNDLDAAAKLAEEIVEKFPWEISAYLAATDAMIAVSELDKALKHLDKALELAPRNEDVYSKRLSVLIRQHRLDDALTLAEEAAEVCLDSTTFEFEQARILRYQGENEKGYGKLLGIINNSRETVYYNTILADWYVEDGKFDEAEKHLSDIFERYTDVPETGIKYAEFLENHQENPENLEKSERVYRRILRTHPNFAPALCGVFDSMTAKGKYFKEAYEELEKRIETNPTLGTTFVIYRLALAACMTRQWKELPHWLEQLTDVEPDDGGNLFVFLWNNLPPKSSHRRKYFKQLRKLLKQEYRPNLAFGMANIYFISESENCRSEEISGFSIHRLCAQALKMEQPDIELLGFVIENRHQLVFHWQLALFVRKHIDFLRDNERTWRAMAAHYDCSAKFAKCVDWTDDWRQRKQINFYLLSSRLASLHGMEEFDEARSLVLETLDKIPHDQMTISFAAEGYYLFAIIEDWKSCDALDTTFAFDANMDEINDYAKSFLDLARQMRNVADEPSKKSFSDAKSAIRGWPGHFTMFKTHRKAKKRYKKWLANIRKNIL
jgi:tetratricopeptide (TPR) repeat protein